MPTRADWEAATPKCPRSSANVTAAELAQLDRDVIVQRCGKPLSPIGEAYWSCPAGHGLVPCSDVAPGPLIATSGPKV